METKIRRPAAGALPLGLVRRDVFLGGIVGRVGPRLVWIAFNLAWLLGWIVFSSGCLPAAYIESGRP
jgi:hypothetical protein